jgi:hypothetical protein
MDRFCEHFDSARRHFGVALIDLNYAAADLTRHIDKKEAGLDELAAVELLNREIERLRQLSQMIDSFADPTAAHDDTPDLVAYWWPDLARCREKARAQRG